MTRGDRSAELGRDGGPLWGTLLEPDGSATIAEMPEAKREVSSAGHAGPDRSEHPSGTEAGPAVARRALLLGGTSLSLGSALGCRDAPRGPASSAELGVRANASACGAAARQADADAAVLELFPLGQPPWKTFDPFLFCVHHRDAYPIGDEALGPRAPLHGRRLGHDFSNKDGWSMYHGRAVPGFPRHPHRGFETVTITRRGYVDHSDSLGATARYGEGDVQWMTAGRGIVHAEMFPLLQSEKPNLTELFQIWLNLPRRSKFVEPHFSMFWSHQLPRPEVTDARGMKTRVTVIAGRYGERQPPSPPPDSWAAQRDAHVAICSVVMQPGARWGLPSVDPGIDRTLYFFAGSGLAVAGRAVASRSGLRLAPGVAVDIEAGSDGAELLLLQGRAIGEPVVAHGPFVMNERHEIETAFRDYRHTQFGGWPWSERGPVHPRQAGRFARHADGREERPA